ncbi:centromere-associated protein E isoform X2 [Pseudorasbora parva]|uniref:centromere-associated protein E isoform X2 n=1 Tax=Pseudorasbora parva TaxID=51549 RepID=UPI00351E6C29
MAEESAVKVCVRVRPLIKREQSERSDSEPVKLYWRSDRQAIHQLDEDGSQTKSFSFDRVFSAEETTGQLYHDIAKPLVVSAVEGYNGTIFAYGQTSSGKTFSMMGSEHNPGVIPLAMADVFKTIKNCPKKEFLLRVSYMEIYNETVTDLLVDSWKRKPLEIREGNYKNVYVADLTEELVTSPEQALSWITKGEKNRHYGKTKMNQRSSRSHTIFRMILESRERSDPASGENADGAIIVSHLNLVDLAGAERASQTGAEGARLKEGCNINRSLFTLGQVIKKLSDESQKGFLNYRDSKLTRILQNSLGGNAKTVIICTITPAAVDETVSTLQFASAAKRMKNDPHVTEVSDEGALLKRYRNEIVDLRRRLQEVSSVTQTTATERESLCQLLQEKDQLQRDQEDRIKNLTKLLVTASNVALIPKVPKRRVTWGGKLLRSAHPMMDLCSTDMSFAEPNFKKRRADFSLPEEGEDMDEFDSRFDFTAMEEPDMEMSNITVRSSSEGHFLESPQANELMVKLASLERQLEAETQSKQRAEEMSAELQLKISELQDKMEARAAPPQEDQTLSELQDKMEAETQSKQRAEEMSAELQLKISELQDKMEAETQSKQRAEEMSAELQLKISELQDKMEAETQSKQRAEEMSAELQLKISELQDKMEAETQSKQRAEEMSAELQLKISELQDKMEAETQSKQRAEEMSAELQLKISELQDKMEAQAAPPERNQTLSELQDKMEALQRRLETELQDRQKAEETIATLELKVEELEKPSEALLRSQNTCEQLKKDLEEVIQICESAGIEKGAVIAERDLFKHSLELMTADLESLKAEKDSLQKDKDSLQMDIDERRDADEFEKLEQESKREYERELESENSRLQQDLKRSEEMIQQLKADLTRMSTELQKKSDLNAELQRFSDKDLVNEVSCLRRSLDDAETLSLETKKEWAFLRSENICLKERDVTLTTDHERLEAAVKTLQDKLELEKSRFKKMQTDLQKELMGAFDENTKLTALLDGKVPKNLTDNLVLEKTVCDLRKELDQSREMERRLQSKMEELETLPVKVEELQTQVCCLSEELRSVREERDALMKGPQELLKMESDLVDAQLKEAELTQHLTETSERLQNLTQENHTLLSSLEEAMQKSLQLSSELECVSGERDALLSEQMERVQREPDETENLRRTINSISEEREQLQEILQGLRDERDQLKRDLEENVEMMIETQAELRDAQEKVKELQGEIHNLESHPVQTVMHEEDQKSKDELQDQIKQLTEEKERLLSETSSDRHELSEAMEKTKANLTSVMEERDQLQERLQRLEEKNEMMLQVQSELQEQQQRLTQEQHDSSALLQQIHTQKEELETLTKQRNQLTLELQESSAQVCCLSEELRSVREERDALMKDPDELLKMESDLVDAQLKEAELTQHLTETSERLQNLTQENHTLLASLEEAMQKSLQLSSELECVSGERDALLSEQMERVQREPDETENLRRTINSISEEREQLQEILQGLRDERDQLKRDLEDTNGMLMQVQQERSGPQTDTHQDELLQRIQMLKEELDAVTEEKSQLKSDLQENVEMMIENQDELRGALEKVKALQSTIQELQSQQTESRSDSEMEEMRASVSSLMEERDQLRLTLQTLRDELRREQQERELTMTELRSELQCVCAERDRVSSERSGELERMSSVTEERDRLLETPQRLADEREELERDRLMLVQVREQLQSACAERDHLLAEKAESDLEKTTLEEMQSSLTTVSEEREQLLDILTLIREEKNQLRRDLEEKDQTVLQLREELQSSSERAREKMETLEANVSALTEEKDRLQESLQAAIDERDQLRREILEKSEMMVLLRQELLSACAERDRLMAERARETACNQSGASCSMTSLSEGGDLQEILQGVRELIQSQGELKQKKPQESDPLSQKAQLEQIGALTEELESLRKLRDVLRADLQEAAATSKMYQDLLHVTKQELKQQQKEKAELMEESAAKESRLGSEIQNLQTVLRSLTEEKDEMVKRAREEGERLRDDLQKSEQTISRLNEELRSLSGVSDQLENEKTHAEQILQSLRDVTREKDELRGELEEKLEKLTHIESKAEQLEKQKILLESEVHSLSQSLTEVNVSLSSDQSNLRVKHRSEMAASDEKLQAAFARLQLVIDHPTDALSEVNREEWAVLYQLVQFIPVAQRNVYATHTKKTTALNNVLINIAEAYRRLAQRCKTHFEMEVQRDTSAFEESRLQDLLVLMAQAPAQASLQEDFQQVWDQRLAHLLERRQQYLQKLEGVLRFLEDGLAKHEAIVSKERQQKTRELEDLKALLRSPQTDAIVHLQEQQIARRSKATEHLSARYIALLNELESEISPLKSSSSESERRLKDLRRETVTLLRAHSTDLPKAEAELLQEKLHLSQRLQHTQMQMEELQEQIKELKTQADSSNQDQHLQLQELRAQLKQKEALIQNLEAKIREAEVQFKRNMSPAAAEVAALKDKLVKMELDHIAVTTSHEREVAQMSSMLEHRADVIRKLKENLRKVQQDDEQSFANGDEFDLKLGSNPRAVTTLKEKMVEELQQKNAQFESLVSKQQEEINKWKRRAYKMKEGKKDCTPTKRQPPLTQTEVNSPKRPFLDSPKSKFFDVRSSVPMSLSHPTQFFDNSNLGTVPEVSCLPLEPPVDSSDSDDEESGSSSAALDDWWQIPSASHSEPDTNVNANACPTQ